MLEESKRSRIDESPDERSDAVIVDCRMLSTVRTWNAKRWSPSNCSILANCSSSVSTLWISRELNVSTTSESSCVRNALRFAWSSSPLLMHTNSS